MNDNRSPKVIKLDVFSSSSRSEPVLNSENFGRPVNTRGMDIGSSPLSTNDRKLLQKSSTQVGPDALTGIGNIMNDFVTPPYSLDYLVNLNSLSVTRRSCIEANATNTAGLGYRIKKVDPKANETDSDQISTQIKMKLEKLSARGGLSFSELIYQVKFDEETTGNGYIEVSRNRKGQIDGLYHIPAHTIRIKKDRSGYVQVTNTGASSKSDVPFYNFGDKVELKEDGTTELKPDRAAGINELMHFKLYSSNSSYYGVPRDIAAIETMIGDNLARAYNNKFFLYSATPEIALIFEVDQVAMKSIYGDAPIKVEIPQDVKRDIEEHFRRNLAAKTFEPAIFHLPPGISLKIEKLSTPTQDSSWTTFRENNKAEIREAHRCPPVIVGGSNDNYATAAIAKSIYLEQVITPEQERYEQRLMSLLWPELLDLEIGEPKVEISISGESSIKPVTQVAPPNGTGVNPSIWKLDFKEMSVADKAVDAQVHNIYGTLGVLDTNEIRLDLGRKEKAGGDKPPQVNPGAEGNVFAQNAQLEQAAAGNPEIPNQPPYVTNPAVTPNKGVDFTGMGKITGGRRHNGSVAPQQPRRPGDTSVPMGSNMISAGHPMQKSNDEITEDDTNNDVFDLYDSTPDGV